MDKIIIRTMFLILLMPPLGHVSEYQTNRTQARIKKAPDFQLEDKNGSNFCLSSMKYDYIILIFFNKNQKKDAVKSAEELTAVYSNHSSHTILLIADMRDIPPFINKEFIRKNSQRELTPVPILFDWNQAVNKIYNVNSSLINYFLIDKTRFIAVKLEMKIHSAANLKIISDSFNDHGLSVPELPSGSAK